MRSFGRVPDGVSEDAGTRATVRIIDNDSRGDRPLVRFADHGRGRQRGLHGCDGVLADGNCQGGNHGHSGIGVSLSSTLLFFTTSHWNTAQTIEASAAQDNDANNDTATLTHTATGAGYAAVAAAIAVMVVYDDRPPAKQTGV